MGNCFSDTYVIPKLCCSRYFHSRQYYIHRNTTLNSSVIVAPRILAKCAAATFVKECPKAVTDLLVTCSLSSLVDT